MFCSTTKKKRALVWTIIKITINLMAINNNEWKTSNINFAVNNGTSDPIKRCYVVIFCREVMNINNFWDGRMGNHLSAKFNLLLLFLQRRKSVWPILCVSVETAICRNLFETKFTGNLLLKIGLVYILI